MTANTQFSKIPLRFLTDYSTRRAKTGKTDTPVNDEINIISFKFHMHYQISMNLSLGEFEAKLHITQLERSVFS